MDVDTPSTSNTQSPMATSPTSQVNLFKGYKESSATVLDTLLFSKTVYDMTIKTKVCMYNFIDLFDHFIIFDFDTYNIKSSTEFEAKFYECLFNPQIDLIIIPIGIKGIKDDSILFGLLHANVVVINKLTKRIDHFDPMGLPSSINYLSPAAVIKNFIYYLEPRVFFKYEINSIIECPYQQYQIKENPNNKTHCLAWVLYVIYHVIGNPYKSVDKLLSDISSAIDVTKDSYDALVRRFIGYLETKMDLSVEINVDNTQRERIMELYVYSKDIHKVFKDLMKQYIQNVANGTQTVEMFQDIMRFSKFSFFQRELEKYITIN
ncbi:hypothetical protein EBZ38_04380 [bacterium]|nr:hypothetical protein [bacterium]